MADLLGSILGSMQKPPSLGEEATRKAKAQRERVEKRQKEDKKILQNFRVKIEKSIHTFVQDASKEKHAFDPMDTVYRAIAHEVAEMAGLTSFSFGLNEQDRYVMIWKKEFAPSDDEVLAYREGRTWDPIQAEKDAQRKKQDELQNKTKQEKIVPTYDYKEKYERLIGREAAKDAAVSTATKRSYGFVSSENKRDQRTIEQVMADSKARKMEHSQRQTNVDQQTYPQTDTSLDICNDVTVVAVQNDESSKLNCDQTDEKTQNS